MRGLTRTVGLAFMFLGGVGIAGSMSARGGAGFIIKGSECKVGDCVDIGDARNHPACSGEPILGLCRFDKSATGLHWCKTSPGIDCTLYNPVVPQFCDGYCTWDPAIGCRNAQSWNLCYLT